MAVIEVWDRIARVGPGPSWRSTSGCGRRPRSTAPSRSRAVPAAVVKRLCLRRLCPERKFALDRKNGPTHLTVWGVWRSQRIYFSLRSRRSTTFLAYDETHRRPTAAGYCVFDVWYSTSTTAPPHSRLHSSPGDAIVSDLWPFRRLYLSTMIDSPPSSAIIEETR